MIVIKEKVKKNPWFLVLAPIGLIFYLLISVPLGVCLFVASVVDFSRYMAAVIKNAWLSLREDEPLVYPDP